MILDPVTLFTDLAVVACVGLFSLIILGVFIYLIKDLWGEL